MANPTYRAPGTAADPWGPYIHEASQHSSVPESWVRAVMHQESGGHEYLDGQPITSSSGAMGLMQLMPQTYADMQDRLNLGADPYDPHDNIAAGTEYIALLSRKYGSPAFLAAYNAGPQRLEAYLNQSRPLPHETVAYVAAISPHLNDVPPVTSETVNTAPDDNTNSVRTAWAKRSYTPVASTPAETDNLPAPVSTVQCDPNAAYDSSDRCSFPLPTLAPPTPTPSNATPVLPPTYAATGPTTTPTPSHTTPNTSPASHYGTWSIQVGAFNSIGQARFAATMARQAAFSTLQSTQATVQAININGRTLWRSRLSGLDAHSATTACHQLSTQNFACIPKGPGQ